MFQVAYTYNTTNSAECRLFGLSELNFIDELRKEITESDKKTVG